jgi:hypothetical protein
LLLPLARAYRVMLDELVDAPPTGDPRIHLRPIRRNGATMLALTLGQVASGLQDLIRASRRKPPDPQHTRATNGCTFSTDGRASLLGKQDLVLASGGRPNSTPFRTVGVPARSPSNSQSLRPAGERHTFAQSLKRRN